MITVSLIKATYSYNIIKVTVSFTLGTDNNFMLLSLITDTDAQGLGIHT